MIKRDEGDGFDHSWREERKRGEGAKKNGSLWNHSHHVSGSSPVRGIREDNKWWGEENDSHASRNVNKSRQKLREESGKPRGKNCR